jgi:hypothetical protein
MAARQRRRNNDPDGGGSRFVASLHGPRRRCRLRTVFALGGWGGGKGRVQTPSLQTADHQVSLPTSLELPSCSPSNIVAKQDP